MVAISVAGAGVAGNWEAAGSEEVATAAKAAAKAVAKAVANLAAPSVATLAAAAVE